MFEKFAAPRRLLISSFLVLAVAASCAGQTATNRGRKYKAPPPTSHVEVTVVRATNGKPVENAAVIFHPMEDGHNVGNMELKTNEDGKAIIDLLAVGSDVRVQIIAPGFQTYGEDYKIDKDAMAIEIKLKRPAEQYSVYKKSEGKKGTTGDADAKPDASKDAPKDSEAKPDAPKDQSKSQDAPPK